MSEASRQRRLHVQNRLQELLARHGPPEVAEAEVIEQGASWGFLSAPVQPQAVRLDVLDRYGETALFGCPRCGQESAKASMPLDVWHCTACGTGGKASALLGAAPPATRIHQV